MNFFRSFVFGVTLPLGAFRVILSQRRLLALSILPIVVTLILYIKVISGLEGWATDAIGGYLSQREWQGWIVSLINGVTGILIFIAAALTFTFASSIVSSPFNDFLAEEAERHGSPPLPKVEGSGLSRQMRLIFLDLVKTVAASVAMILALILSWIPILNIAALTLSFLLVTYQFVTYPQTRRGVRLRESFRFLRQHFFACLGFGAVTLGMFSIPFASVLALPIAVVGGTLLFARAETRDPYPLG